MLLKSSGQVTFKPTAHLVNPIGKTEPCTRQAVGQSMGYRETLDESNRSDSDPAAQLACLALIVGTFWYALTDKGQEGGTLLRLV